MDSMVGQQGWARVATDGIERWVWARVVDEDSRLYVEWDDGDGLNAAWISSSDFEVDLP